MGTTDPSRDVLHFSVTTTITDTTASVYLKCIGPIHNCLAIRLKVDAFRKPIFQLKQWIAIREAGRPDRMGVGWIPFDDSKGGGG
jgi:hypothetical protein